MVSRITMPVFGRSLIAISFSLLFLRLPGLMPMPWKWLIISLILVFFLFIPDTKGIKGGVIAGFFSLVFAGLGQLYVREYGRGLLFITLGIFAYMTTDYSSKAWVFNNILFIISAIDAFSFGKRGFGIF